MSVKRIIALLLIMLINFSSAFAQQVVDLKEIVNQLPKLTSIKCKFKQEKIIQNVEKPVISSGDFEFIEDRGVYFYTTYPVKTTTNYTTKNYKQINDIINAMAAKKYDKLEREFDFSFEGTKNKWSLDLKPKSNRKASEFISNIKIEGSDYIKKIVISMTNKSKTTIWFKKIGIITGEHT